MKLRKDSILQQKKIKEEINNFSPGIDKVTRSVSAIVQLDARQGNLIREVDPTEEYLESSGSGISVNSS